MAEISPVRLYTGQGLHSEKKLGPNLLILASHQMLHSVYTMRAADILHQKKKTQKKQANKMSRGSPLTIYTIIEMPLLDAVYSRQVMFTATLIRFVLYVVRMQK